MSKVYPWFHDPFNGKGNLLVNEPDRAVWVYEEEPGKTYMCTQTVHDEVIERNKQLYNDSAGKRWGDGKIAASIPLAHYFHSGLAEARKQEDEKWIKRWLNDPDNRAFRTFEGNI